MRELSTPSKTEKNGNSFTHESKIQNNDVQLLNYVHTDATAMFSTPGKEKKKEASARQEQHMKITKIMCITAYRPHVTRKKSHSCKFSK